MSEQIIPEEIREVISDVAEKVEKVVDEVVDEVKEKVEDVKEDVQEAVENITDKAEDLGGKTLAELSELFQQLKDSADSMSRSKEAESIKSAFYKLLIKLKGENPVEGEEASINNPFESVEQNFKALYGDYKKERAEFNKKQDEQREANLEAKKAIIEELRSLVENQEDVSSQFPAFRDIQNRWREAGPVPATTYRDINDQYQYLVEKFYDMVKINRDLRDLDFKKNLEAKLAFCEAAEKLADNDNVVNAFHELQKLHEQWKEFGPVAKEKRDEIWNRFKAATAVVNKRYQAYFEGLKDKQAENLEAKTALCEKVEALADQEVINSGDWNTISKQIEDIQSEWRKIGFATKKENQKIYDRFRAACDKFYTRKRDFYSEFKDSMNGNLDKKMDIIRQAEELKTSTDWKKATDQFIALQKQWKEIGAVPRKKSEQLWKRFRAACDEFFAERDKQAKPENDYYGNLKLKKKLIEEIEAFVASDSETANADAMRDFNERWQAIGHVPFKEKDNVNSAFRKAMQDKFPLFSQRSSASARQGRAPKSPKDILIEKYHALQQDITTYENNIGFFSASKNSEPLIKQMQERIEEAKAELKNLEEQIHKSEEGEQ